jgi:hypothetical protein
MPHFLQSAVKKYLNDLVKDAMALYGLSDEEIKIVEGSG